MIKKLHQTLERTTASLDIKKTLKKITFYTWISAGVFFACYIYFIGAITFSVIKEKGLQQQTKTLTSTMGQQELQYLSLQKNLTEQYAQSVGLIPADRVSFATPQKSFAWNVGH